jgi:hypothetical protein
VCEGDSGLIINPNTAIIRPSMLDSQRHGIGYGSYISQSIIVVS